MKKAVIMCRVSSDEQAKGYSLDVQFESLTRHCAREGVEIIKHYKEDHSAKNFSRPEFKKFLEYAKSNKGKIDMLLITSWDRFSRNLTDSLIMLRKLKAMGIEVHAIEQPIDMSIPENKAMLAIFLAIPEIDNERRSIKIRGGVRGALKSGRWCRVAPIGYRNTRDSENKPIIVPDERAEFIQKMFKYISLGNTQSEARRSLNAEGFKISKTGISKILRNKVYIGKIVVPELDDEPLKVIEGIHDAIIEEDLFNQVQDIIEGRANQKRVKTNKSKLRAELPLRGVMKCSKCDKMMTGSPSKGRHGKKYFYYHCNFCHDERISAIKANALIEDCLGKLSFTESANTIYKMMVKELLSGDENELKKKKLEQEKGIKNTEARITKTQDLFIDGKIDESTYSESMKRYRDSKRKMEESQEAINRTPSRYSEWLKTGVNAMKNLSEQYKSSNVQGKQNLLVSIFPENFSISAKNCRTPRINDVLRYILQINNELTQKTGENFSSNLEISSLVEPGGVEPPSKQGRIGISTCLFRD